MNIIVVSSPQAQVGKTTIANFCGLKATSSTLLLEMGKLGYSPYIHGTVNASEKRSISRVMINPSSLKDNLFQTSNKYLRFCSMNVVEDIMRLNLPNVQVGEIMEEASKVFNNLIIDTSSDLHSGVNKTIFTKEFREEYNINDVVVIDENIATFKALSDFNEILKSRDLTIRPIIVINKCQSYEDYMKVFLNKLSNIKPAKIIPLNNIPEMVYYLNNGEVDVDDKDVDKFRAGIDTLLEQVEKFKIKKEFVLKEFLM